MHNHKAIKFNGLLDYTIQYEEWITSFSSSWPACFFMCTFPKQFAQRDSAVVYQHVSNTRQQSFIHVQSLNRT